MPRADNDRPTDVLEFEPRRHARYACDQKAWFDFEDGALYSRVANLSVGGAFVPSLFPRRAGEAVLFSLPVWGLRAKAKVRWYGLGPDRYVGFGLEFEEPIDLPAEAVTGKGEP